MTDWTTTLIPVHAFISLEFEAPDGPRSLTLTIDRPGEGGKGMTVGTSRTSSLTLEPDTAKGEACRFTMAMLAVLAEQFPELMRSDKPQLCATNTA